MRKKRLSGQPEKAEIDLRCYPTIKRRREYCTHGDAAGRGARGSVACIAGARHTTLSPLLISLGTFLFSDKKVPPPAGGTMRALPVADEEGALSPTKMPGTATGE